MRNRFDQLAKQIGQEALGPSGTTIANDEINPETQYADLRHEPHPERQAERDRLGLLGRFAAFSCLIEVYSQAPSPEEFRACLAKHLASWQQRTRKARTDSRRSEPPPEAPFLWVIAAGVPTTLLTKLKLETSLDWPAGVYFFGADVLRVGIVAASELPRESSTLLVRIMAAGPLLTEAVREVAALPPEAYGRAVAEPVLVSFQHLLGQISSPTTDEQEFLMAMHKSWEDVRVEGRAEGRAEGSVEAQANAVLTVLQARGIAIPDAVRERILVQKDLGRLKRWLERASVASSIADVIDDPS